MAGHEVEFLDRTDCGDDVGTFRFTRPDEYTFAAGQWFRLTLQTSEGPVTQTFSHDTSPLDSYLELTARNTGSSFKRALWALKPGDPATVVGPGGHLVLPAGATKLAILAGGVGITPIRGLLRDASERGVVFDEVVLFYGTRDPSCAPFLEELEGMRPMGVRVVPVYQHHAPPGTEAGLISADIIRRHVDPDDGRPFMVTGPPAMVAAMEAVLDEVSVPSESRIIERFGPLATAAR